MRFYLVGVLGVDVILDSLCAGLLKILRGYLDQVRESGLLEVSNLWH